METDYLCLGSGHNDLAKEVADHLDRKFKYELDVVSVNVYLYYNIFLPLFLIYDRYSQLSLILCFIFRERVNA